jgi:hypothetical protein
MGRTVRISSGSSPRMPTGPFGRHSPERRFRLLSGSACAVHSPDDCNGHRVKVEAESDDDDDHALSTVRRLAKAIDAVLCHDVGEGNLQRASLCSSTGIAAGSSRACTTHRRRSPWPSTHAKSEITFAEDIFEVCSRPYHRYPLAFED